MKENPNRLLRANDFINRNTYLRTLKALVPKRLRWALRDKMAGQGAGVDSTEENTPNRPRFCKHEHTEVIYRRPSENGNYPLEIVQCTECQLAFHKEMPTPEQIKQVIDRREQYEKDEYPYFLNKDLDNPIPNYDFYDFVNKQLLGWSKHGLEPVSELKFLDIGCGPGFSFHVLAKHGWECYALEANPWARDLIRRLEPHTTIADSLEELPDNAFSLIFSIHSIEHLTDPVAMIREVSRILAPGGEVIIHTPDTDAPETYNYENPEHLFFFNEYSLRYWLNYYGLDTTLVDRPPMNPPSVKVMAVKR